MKKSLLATLSLALAFNFIPTSLKANQALKDDDTYRIADVKQDGTLEIIKEYKNMSDAYKDYPKLLEQYENLALAKGLDYLEAEIALVSFKKSEGCDVNVEYNAVETGADGYTNGCYGGDGAYLGKENGAIQFKLSGVVAQAQEGDVKIVPFAKNRVSYYIVKNAQLYHYIKTDVEASGHGNILSLGPAPATLVEDVPYYSYDGHYFYDNYALMIRDYQNKNDKQAINASEPYYNYYQYVSHRSSSNYQLEDVTSQFDDRFGIHQTMSSLVHDGNYQHMNISESLLVQGLPAFFQYQNQFGANAMMMMSLAMNESNYGRSALAFSRNNLFGHAAYDEDVDANASGYRKVADSIYYHANDYISRSYLNPDSFTYHGAHFGNKAGGMNVSYASDPYWGEKAAQFYLNIDEAFGKKDYEAYRIGVSFTKTVKVKKDASDASTTLYSAPAYQETSFLILSEQTRGDVLWYEVALDTPLLDGKNGRNYDFSQSRGYVKASDLDYASKNTPAAKEYISIQLDAGKGHYYPNDSKITLSVEKNMTPAMTHPELVGHHFIGYQEEVVPAAEAATYHAQYVKIDDVQLEGTLQQEYCVGEYLNINGAKLKVICGEESFEIPLTTDYVSGFTSRSIGKHNMVVTYSGHQIDVNYEVKELKDTTLGKLKQDGQKLIADYEHNGSFTTEQITQINEMIEQLKSANHALDIATIRYLDRILEPYNQPRLSVILNDEKYDLQASGLAFQEIPESLLTKYVPVTLQLSLNSIQHPYQQKVQNTLATNYYQLEDVFQIEMQADFTEITPVNDMVYSLKKPENSENKLYRIFEINEDGSLCQVPSEQSKERITFQSKKSNFALVSITQKGIADSFDFTEVYHQGREMKNYITTIQTIAISCGAVGITGIALFVFFLLKRKKQTN